MYNNKVYLFFVLSFIGTAFAGNFVIDWARFTEKLRMDTVTQGNLNLRIRIGIAYRIESVVDWCAYNTWALYDHKAIPLVDLNAEKVVPVTGTVAENIKTSVSYAIYRCLRHEYRNFDQYFLTEIDNYFTGLGYDKTYDVESLNNAPAIGNYVADKTLAFTDTDGCNADGTEPNGLGNGVIYSDYTGYFPINDHMPLLGKTDCTKVRSISHHQPARIKIPGTNTIVPQNPMDETQFSRYKPYALKSLDQFMPPAPPRYGSNRQQAFVDMQQGLVDVFGTLDDTKKAHGVFGQSELAHQRPWAVDVCDIKNYNVGDSIKLLLLESQSQMEALGGQLFAKRFYSFARPTTPIQCLYAGQTITSFKGPYQGIGSIDGADWTTYLPSNVIQNNGPEYPCGHCTQSGALAEVLRLALKSNTYVGTPRVVAAGTSFVEPKVDNPSDPRYVAGVTDVPNTGPATIGYAPANNITINFATWTDVEETISTSRLYLGVHYRYSADEGMILGRKIGQVVFEKLSEKFNALKLNGNPNN